MIQQRPRNEIGLRCTIVSITASSASPNPNAMPIRIQVQIDIDKKKEKITCRQSPKIHQQIQQLSSASLMCHHLCDFCDMVSPDKEDTGHIFECEEGKHCIPHDSVALGIRCGENCVHALCRFVKVGAFTERGFCGEGSVWQMAFDLA